MLLYIGTNYHPHDESEERWETDIELMRQANTDNLVFIVHSGANGYTKNEVQGKRINNSDWWYMETADAISNHLGELEEIGWWFQIQLECGLITDHGVPEAMLRNVLPDF